MTKLISPEPTSPEDTPLAITTEQRVDWHEPEAAHTLKKIHWRWLLHQLRISLMMFAVLVGVAIYDLVTQGNPMMLALAGVIVLLIFMRVASHFKGLRRSIDAMGPLTFSLTGNNLHLRHAINDGQWPLDTLSKVQSYPQGMVLQFADRSVMTIPAGPVQQAIEKRLSA